jgi:hypothetical protein
MYNYLSGLKQVLLDNELVKLSMWGELIACYKGNLLKDFFRLCNGPAFMLRSLLH